MDKNTVIGLSLIFVRFMVWQSVLTPSKEEVAEQQRLQDSITMVEQRADSLAQLQNTPPPVKPDSLPVIPDSLLQAKLSGEFGPFSAAAAGEEQLSVLENELFIVTFTNKGGRIKEMELKKHFKLVDNEEKKEVRKVLKLLEDEKNKFEYFLPIANLPSGGVNTGDLFFKAQTTDNTITFRAEAGNDRYFEQRYTIKPETYQMDYSIHFQGLNNVISQTSNEITLNWLNYLDKLEKNTRYERNYSSVYFKPIEDDPDHCTCTSDDTDDADNQRLKWVSHSNQFFNSSLVAKESFNSGIMENKMLEEEAKDLKILTTTLKIPYLHNNEETFDMLFYVGPNEFDRLYAINHDLEDIIPYGSSIFGTINRWVIRPLFNFLSNFIGSKGIVILFLTIIVKILLYPLTFRMLYSQSKMGALKPRILMS